MIRPLPICASSPLLTRLAVPPFSRRGSALVLSLGFLSPRPPRPKRRPVAVVIFGGLKTRILSATARRYFQESQR
jgi:hypothetical protein